MIPGRLLRGLAIGAVVIALYLFVFTRGQMLF
jgi:hypothetical protein